MAHRSAVESVLLILGFGEVSVPSASLPIVSTCCSQRISTPTARI